MADWPGWVDLDVVDSWTCPYQSQAIIEL